MAAGASAAWRGVRATALIVAVAVVLLTSSIGIAPLSPSVTPASSRAAVADRKHAAAPALDACSLLPSCSAGDCSEEQQCRSGLCGAGAAPPGPPTEQLGGGSTTAPLARLQTPFDVAIRSPVETIKMLSLLLHCRVPAVFLRFGDGDIVNSESQVALEQEPDDELAAGLRLALSLRGFNVIKTLPLDSNAFGFWPGMQEGTVFQGPDSYTRSVAQKALHLFVGEPVYSTIALHYTSLYRKPDAMRFLALLKLSCPVFVGNAQTPLFVRNAIFGAGHTFIPTPPKNAWTGYRNAVWQPLLARLGAEATAPRPFQVVVFAMGSPGRAIAAMLFRERLNTFSFDFGSLLDWLSGNVTRDWIRDRQGELDSPAVLVEELSRLPSGC